MAPDQRFKALQTAGGEALFFSIGTDRVLYLTRELRGGRTGWAKQDLSSGLSQQHDGAQVTAKAFDVSQNARSGAIDLALAIAVGGVDFLYLSLGNSNADTAWAAGIEWSYVAFDDPNHPMPALGIADLYILQTPAGAYFVADILKPPPNPLHLIYRYYMTPAAAQQWHPHDLAANLAAGSIDSCLGQRSGDYVAGIYTFGTIAGTPELLYTPLYNAFNPAHLPNPARLTLPPHAAAIAAASGADGTSNLFVAADRAIYLFTSDNQKDGAVGVAIATNNVFAGVQSLRASTGSTKTAVWGINQAGDLFYIQCNLGNEASAAAWSTPVPILTNVEQIASFLNAQADSSVIFAHTQGRNLVQLTQDAATTEWQQRRILLPSADPNDMVSYKSFTTHIKVTDDYNQAAYKANVAVTSVSPVSVYLNDVYHVLSPDVPVQVTTDAVGVLTVVQETQALAAVCLHVQLPDAGVTADVNPMGKLLHTLGAIQVTNADGSQQPLLAPDITADQRDAAAQSLKQFVTIAGKLPQDGSRQDTTGHSALFAAAVNPAMPLAQAPHQLWGVTFGAGGWAYHEGEAAARHFVQHPASASLLALAPGAHAMDVGSAIEVAAGDFFRWLTNAFEQVESFFVKQVDDVYHFFIKIAGDLYHLILDAVSAVVHAVELVLNKLKVFFEDLVKGKGRPSKPPSAGSKRRSWSALTR